MFVGIFSLPMSDTNKTVRRSCAASNHNCFTSTV